MSVTVRKNLCPQNHPCPAVYSCPAGAMTQQGLDAPTIDGSKCTYCGKCVRHCPTGALLIAK